MSKTLSIIIPAYNVERFLPKCVDSIIDERIMNDAEVLIINDGSKDGTLFVAQQYASKYPSYIKAIDKPNGNYGSVMNKALEICEGKYFRTLDADDYFDKENFVKFVNELKKTDADMVITEWSFDYEGKIENQVFESDIIPNKDIFVESPDFKFHPESPLLSIHGITYKVEKLKQSGIRWDEGISYTDTEYCFWPIKYIESVRYVPLNLYYYFIGREEQTMSQTSLRKNFNSFYIVANSIYDNLVCNQAKNSIMFAFQKRYIRIVSKFIYENLLIEDNKHELEIKKFDNKIKGILSLYEEIGNDLRFKRIKYVKLFRGKGLGLFLIKVLRFIHNFEYSK